MYQEDLFICVCMLFVYTTGAASSLLSPILSCHHPSPLRDWRSQSGRFTL